MPVMNTRLVRVILTSVVIALLSASEAAFPAPSSKHTIRIDRLSVAFDVPRGFVVLQTDNRHHLFHTIISFGREFRPGHLTSAPLRLVFWPDAFDGNKSVTQYTPSQYVDAEFEKVMEGFRQQLPGFEWEPQYVKLFGNRAVRYTVDDGLGGGTVILGYLRKEQLPKRLRPFVEEYLVRIDFDGSPLDEDLLDTVVNSLRTFR